MSRPARVVDCVWAAPPTATAQGSLYAQAMPLVSEITARHEALAEEFIELGHDGGATLRGPHALIAALVNRLTRRPGRRANPFEHNLLLHAAVVAECKTGVSKLQAAARAAKRLGSPITTEMAKKASRPFLAEAGRRYGDEAARTVLVLVAEARRLLEGLDNEAAAQRRATAELCGLGRHARPLAG